MQWNRHISMMKRICRKITILIQFSISCGAFYPRGTNGHCFEVRKVSLLLVRAGVGQIDVAAPDCPEGEDREEHEVEDEVVVVLLPDTVPHPGAVMIKPGGWDGIH